MAGVRKACGIDFSVSSLSVEIPKSVTSADGWQEGPSAQHIGSCSKRVRHIGNCSKCVRPIGSCSQNVQDSGSCSTPSSSTFKEEKEMDTICWSSRIDSTCFGSRAGRSPRIKTQKFCDSIAESPFAIVCYIAKFPFELVCSISLRQATTAQHRRLVLRLELREQHPCLLPRQCRTDNGGYKFCSQHHVEHQ